VFRNSDAANMKCGGGRHQVPDAFTIVRLRGCMK
jgi:hypothetical protein